MSAVKISPKKEREREERERERERNRSSERTFRAPANRRFQDCKEESREKKKN